MLLLKPGVWSRGLPGILRKLHLAKFCVVGMKHLDLDAATAAVLLPPQVQQVGEGSGSSVFASWAGERDELWIIHS